MSDPDRGVPVLETRHITKQFPGVLANEDINLTLQRGEILALLGENGAGKSTLMNVIYGLYHPTEGEIRIKGQPVKFDTPNDAIRMGIGMVHQHFQLVPVMTVAENVMLGSESVKRGFLDTRAVAQRIRELSTRYGLAVDPYALVEDLPVGVRQRVEIVKTLYRERGYCHLGRTDFRSHTPGDRWFVRSDEFVEKSGQIYYLHYAQTKGSLTCERPDRCPAQRSCRRRGRSQDGNPIPTGGHDGWP